VQLDHNEKVEAEALLTHFESEEGLQTGLTDRRVGREKASLVKTSSMEEDRGTWAYSFLRRRADEVRIHSRVREPAFATESSPTWGRRRDDIPARQRRLGSEKGKKGGGGGPKTMRAPT
jgi:hypothetical protein